MQVVYHHRTRGKGAEGAHIRGIVDGFRKLGHSVSIQSFPGVKPEEDKEVSLANVQADARAAVRNEEHRSLLSKLAESSKYAPEVVFEFYEILYNLLVLIRLGKLVNNTKPGLIYERYSMFMVGGILIAKIFRVPVVLEINDSALVDRVRPLYLRKLARLFEAWAFRNANGLVFISSYFKDQAMENYRDMAPAIVLPNGADTDKFNANLYDREKIRKSLGIEDKMVCGYVGAFVYWHGIDWFANKVIPIIKQHPNLVLLLVGDGVCYKEIMNQVVENNVEQQVILTGRVDHEKVPYYIAAMDYGILPDSNQYGSPMKLFEFMAMGKAMVSPAFPPIAEVVRDGETGWLFEPGDQQACVDLVLKLAEEEASIKEVGNNAQHYIERNRQWKHNVESVFDLIK